MNNRPEDDEGGRPQKSSFLQTMKAVAWAFFGVRKASDQRKDAQQLNPVHLVIAAVLGAALFIALLLTIVNWVTAGAVAH